jgi:hypothetical protein
MLELLLSKLAFPELIYTEITFLGLIFFLILFIFLNKTNLKKLNISLKSICPLIVLIIILIIIFNNFVLDIPPLVSNLGHVWKYAKQSEIIQDQELALREKLIQVPSVHKSHPSGYGFLIYLTRTITGPQKGIILVNLIIMIVSVTASYILLKSKFKKSLMPFLITAALTFIPVYLLMMVTSQTELLALPLTILLAYLTTRISQIKNRHLNPIDKITFILILLTVLGLSYTKFEFASVIFIIPFILLRLPLKKNKFFLTMSVIIFLFLFMPVLHHTFYYNHNQGNASSFSKIVPNFFGSSTTLTILGCITIITPVFLFIRFKNPVLLYPLFFTLIFLSFERTTFLSFRYLSSFMIALSFLFWWTFLQFHRLKKTTKGIMIVILISFLILNVAQYDRIRDTYKNQKGYQTDFFEIIGNCSYYNEEHTLNLYQFPYAEISINYINNSDFLDNRSKLKLCNKESRLIINKNNLTELIDKYDWIVLTTPYLPNNFIGEMRINNISYDMPKKNDFMKIINISKKEDA